MPSKQPSYTNLKAELDQLLSKLQAEDVELEDAMKLYERSMEIVTQLELQLKNAENKIIKLKNKFS